MSKYKSTQDSVSRNHIGKSLHADTGSHLVISHREEIYYGHEETESVTQTIETIKLVSKLYLYHMESLQ